MECEADENVDDECCPVCNDAWALRNDLCATETLST